MSNEHTLLVAILDIGREDTVATVGLVALTSDANPIRRWKDLADAPTNGIAVQFVSGPPNEGAPEKQIGVWRFDAFVPDGVEGLESTILDRLHVVLTQQALEAKSIDCSVRRLVRRDNTALAANGRRMTQDYRLTLTR